MSLYVHGVPIYVCDDESSLGIEGLVQGLIDVTHDCRESCVSRGGVGIVVSYMCHTRRQERVVSMTLLAPVVAFLAFWPY